MEESMINGNTLRVQLHRMIDEVLDQALIEAQQRQVREEMKLSIVAGNLQQDFTYKFPKDEVPFSEGRWYEVQGPHGYLKMLLAKTEGKIWHATYPVYFVFARESGPENPLTTFDCTQFTKTDTGEFSSVILNPADPKKKLKAGMPLPPRYANAKIERTDKLYTSVKNAPTLRLVVQETDVDVMLTHGYYVAHLRNRF
jgi:hypothetical protein